MEKRVDRAGKKFKHLLRQSLLLPFLIDALFDEHFDHGLIPRFRIIIFQISEQARYIPDSKSTIWCYQKEGIGVLLL
jgi:hypothetical protein